MAGNRLAGGAAVDFYVLAGDFNRDRTVNGADLNVLIRNFGRSGGPPAGVTFTTADSNYDGRVTIADFFAVRGNYGRTLTPPPAGSAIVAPTGPTRGGSAVASRSAAVRAGL